MLSKALGVEGQNYDRQEGSTPPLIFVPPGRRSVLDDNKFGPGNRPYWEMKEGQVSTRYPGLLRALSKIQDPEKHRLLFESHRRKMGSTIANPARRLERKRIGLARQ